MTQQSFAVKSEQDREQLEKQRIARLFRTDDGKLFIQRIRKEYDIQARQIASAREIVDVGRCQGKLDVLDWILSLLEE